VKVNVGAALVRLREIRSLSTPGYKRVSVGP
jgi:hypothetical protein